MITINYPMQMMQLSPPCRKPVMRCADNSVCPFFLHDSTSFSAVRVGAGGWVGVSPLGRLTAAVCPPPVFSP